MVELGLELEFGLVMKFRLSRLTNTMELEGIRAGEVVYFGEII